MSERGQMLVVFLWVMGLIGLAVGAVTVRASHELRLSRVPLEQVQRQAVAEAAVHHAMALVARDIVPTEDHLADAWATGLEDGRQILMDVPVGQGVFRVGGVDTQRDFHAGLLDEERNVNVNTAPPQVLAALMAATGIEGNLPAQDVVAAIVDWRDSDPGPWCGEGSGTQCRNGPLQSLEELLLVPGMTPALFAALQPFVTVFGHGAININTASSTVLNALGWAGEALVQQRAEAQPPVLPPGACPGTVAHSEAFRVPVEAQLTDSSPVLQLSAVVHRDGRILAWDQE